MTDANGRISPEQPVATAPDSDTVEHMDDMAPAGGDHDESGSGLHESVKQTLAAYGSSVDGLRVAHSGEFNRTSGADRVRPDRVTREGLQDALLSTFATRAVAAGNRAVPEAADPFRTSFEKDLDRIKYASSFRRLAGKCQVFVAPSNDMLRTRLTHSLEVAQVGAAVAQGTGLNTALVEAMALGHDCGHGPGGHAAEEAFSPFIPGGFDHAVWGADVALAALNLCAETLDGIRNHSWKRPSPFTPEGSVVSWADRIAYVCHDFSDAVRAGILSPADLPVEVAEIAGRDQSDQLGFFIDSLINGTNRGGVVGMNEDSAAVLDVFRRFNYENIYLRQASNEQASRVIRALTGLVEHFAQQPGLIPDLGHIPMPGSDESAVCAVRYVATMTDRYAFGLAVSELGFRAEDLPLSV